MILNNSNPVFGDTKTNAKNHHMSLECQQEEKFVNIIQPINTISKHIFQNEWWFGYCS